MLFPSGWKKKKRKKRCTTVSRSITSMDLVRMHHHDSGFVSHRQLEQYKTDEEIDGCLNEGRRLICSGVINHRHKSYVCQRKSFWLQIQCAIENHQQKENVTLQKCQGVFLLNKETKSHLVSENVYVYIFSDIIYEIFRTRAHSHWSSCHGKSGCDDKNKGRQTSWGRRQSVRQNLNKASASSVEYLNRFNSPTCSWSTSLDLLQSEQETPAEGKEETSSQFFDCAPRWDQIFWMLHESNRFFHEKFRRFHMRWCQKARRLAKAGSSALKWKRFMLSSKILQTIRYLSFYRRGLFHLRLFFFPYGRPIVLVVTIVMETHRAVWVRLAWGCLLFKKVIIIHWLHVKCKFLF